MSRLRSLLQRTGRFFECGGRHGATDGSDSSAQGIKCQTRLTAGFYSGTQGKMFSSRSTASLFYDRQQPFRQLLYSWWWTVEVIATHVPIRERRRVTASQRRFGNTFEAIRF